MIVTTQEGNSSIVFKNAGDQINILFADQVIVLPPEVARKLPETLDAFYYNNEQWRNNIQLPGLTEQQGSVGFGVLPYDIQTYPQIRVSKNGKTRIISITTDEMRKAVADLRKLCNQKPGVSK